MAEDAQKSVLDLREPPLRPNSPAGALQSGLKSRSNGFSLDDNPYNSFEKDLWHLWRAGWSAGTVAIQKTDVRSQDEDTVSPVRCELLKAAFQEGLRARDEEMGLGANPYAGIDDVASQAWVKGWASLTTLGAKPKVVLVTKRRTNLKSNKTTKTISVHYERKPGSNPVKIGRHDLAKVVEENFGHTPKESIKIVDDIIRACLDTLISRQSLTISEFGTFVVKHKKEMRSGLPTLSPTQMIPARNVVKFKPHFRFEL